VAAVVRVAEHLERGRRSLRVAEREPLGATLSGDDDHPLDELGALGRGEDVDEHRLDQRRALRPVE
jgi:hypothetical protein